MAHVFTFLTSQFVQSEERANPINPIAGESVLKWLALQLAPQRFKVGVPDTEDWGWYADVESGDRSYLLGASGEWGEATEPVEWTVQLELQRSFRDKLIGRNTMTPDDPLSAAIETALRGNPQFSDVRIDRRA